MIDLAYWLCDLHYRVLQTICILHDYTRDDIDENLSLFCGKSTHHTEVDPLYGMLRKSDLIVLLPGAGRFICLIRRPGDRRFDKHVA